MKVSGGGRCNVTHACFSIAEMVRKYPRGSNFLKRSFHHFFTTDTIKWFEERGVKTKTESDGRMFPVSDDSQTIIDCLLKETSKYGVTIRTNTECQSLTRINEKWSLRLKDDSIIEADFVCLASGGYQRSLQFEWIKKLGHSIEEPVPSLFTFNMPGNPISQLMGITIEDVTVKIQGTRFIQQGPLLITHWGMSGPAILKLSAFAARYLHEQEYDFRINVQWLPQFNENSLLEEFRELRNRLASQKFINRNPFQIPQRLWQYFMQQAGINEEIRWADLPAKEQNKLVKILTGQEFHVKGKTTFKEEFVTSGGVKLNEVDANTFESKIHPSLFFAGEVLDIDGITGGFNFQSAWTGGYLVAKSISDQGLLDQDEKNHIPV